MDEQMTVKQRAGSAVSWLGPIVLGVLFLLAGSVYASKQAVGGQISFLPRAGERQPVGGDVILDQLPPSRPLVPLLKNPTSTFPSTLTAESVIALDDRTDTILYEKNSTEIRSLASISKLLTSLVLVDLPMRWASTTVVTEADSDGSSHHINVGEKYTLEDLFHIALVGSSNTAINALVRESGLTQAEFVERLNAKAAELHLTSVKVVEPTGLDEQNVGNVIDVGRLLEVALKNDRIRSILEIGEYYAKPIGQAKKRRIWSTNWLLTKWIPSEYDKNQVVGKTGFINNSLYNVAMQFETEAHHPIRVIVFGSATNESRFTEARDVADWIFSEYVWPDQPGYEQLSN